MPPAIAELFQQVKVVISRMTLAQKMTIGSLAIAATVGLVAVGILSMRPDFRTAYHNLSPSDTSSIVDKLESLGIAYRILDNGTTIDVPRKDVARVRMTVAGEGLIRDSSPGWELFDNLDVGLTDTLFSVKKQRAMEGELERDISTLDPVERAHVTLSLPQETVFTRQRENPTASVVLQVRAGHDVATDEVAAIVALVRTAVGQGMTSDDVTVLDQHARLLSKTRGENSDPQYGTLLARQKELEAHLTSKAEGMLAATVGAGKAAVRVSVTLTQDEIEEMTESHDPESRMVVHESVKSTDRKDAAPSGMPAGTEARLNPQEPPPVATQNGSETTEDVDTEYLVDRTTRKVTHNPGAIARLTVGMLVDESLASKVQELEEVVKTTLGFDVSRGDVMKTTSLSFVEQQAETPVIEEGPSELILALIRHGSEALTVLAVLFILRTLFLRRRAGSLPGTSPHPAGGVPAAATSPQFMEPSQIQQEITQAVETQPETAAQVLHGWLYEEQEASP